MAGSDYKHKVPNPKGAEVEFKWSLTKNVTDYISNEIGKYYPHVGPARSKVDVDGKRKFFPMPVYM